jgi:hypothetical protein
MGRSGVVTGLIRIPYIQLVSVVGDSTNLNGNSGELSMATRFGKDPMLGFKAEASTSLCLR